MTVTQKTSRQKGFRDGESLVAAEHAPAECENIRIVVRASHLRFVLSVAKPAADPVDFVRRDAHSDTGSADKNAENGLFVQDFVAGRNSEVGVVHRCRAIIAATIDKFVFGLHLLDQKLFQLVAAMIWSNCYFHVNHGTNKIFKY